MNFTSREDYGLRAVLDIAFYGMQTPVHSSEIAVRQRIPAQYLSQLLAMLRRADVVRSVRGPQGGFVLARSPEQISVGDVIRALSGPVIPMQCMSEAHHKQCSRSNDNCSVSLFWTNLKECLSMFLDGTTIQDLLEDQYRLDAPESYTEAPSHPSHSFKSDQD